jgi:hypothetical protein
MLIEHCATDTQFVQEIIDAVSPPMEHVGLRECPFCDDRLLWNKLIGRSITKTEDALDVELSSVSTDVYQRHVAYHLEQIALFAVPSAAQEDLTEDEDTDSENSKQNDDDDNDNDDDNEEEAKGDESKPEMERAAPNSDAANASEESVDEPEDHLRPFPSYFVSQDLGLVANGESDDDKDFVVDSGTGGRMEESLEDDMTQEASKDSSHVLSGTKHVNRCKGD